MAAASDEFAAAMGRKLAEGFQESASVGDSALVAIPSNADRGVDQRRAGNQAQPQLVVHEQAGDVDGIEGLTYGRHVRIAGMFELL